ncbi:MAG: ABC transporter permease [Chloroflexi bacterium]|nr:ABC transporter permease [Chloroflexota bacterium]
MLRFIVRRLLLVIPVCFGISVLVFLLIHLVPGDPARVMLGLQANEESVAAIREQWGLNRPLPIQYVDWVWRLLQGDLGRSYLTNEPVFAAVLGRLPATLTLALAAFIISLVIAIPIGIISGTRPYSTADYGAMLFAQLGVAIPEFWLGIMFILMFSLYLGWVPPSGYVGFSDNPISWFQHLILPALTVGLVNGAVLTRFLRSSILEVMHQDYVRTARAKGVAEQRVIMLHALRNALIPTITVIGLQFAFMLGGVVVVEVIFAWPGVGRLALDAIQRRDYPMVQGAVLAVAITFVIINLLVDIVYAVLDPRIKY